MPKLVRLLVTVLEGETSIYRESQLDEMGMDDDFIQKAFGNRAYWMSFNLLDNTFADQQLVTQEVTDPKTGNQDSSLLPQKRFIKAVEQGSWKKRFCDADHEEILPVSENAFRQLQPPGLGNIIDIIILERWYPGGTRSLDFMRELLRKQKESGSANVSTSSPSIPES